MIMMLRDFNKLIIFPVVRRVCKELQLFVLPNGRVVLYAWSTDLNWPKVMYYSKDPDELHSLPFLYMPMTKYGYKWLFIRAPTNLTDSSYYYLGAIGSYIPAKALLMNMNSVHVHKRTVRLEINWAGSSRPDYPCKSFIVYPLLWRLVV